MVLSDEVIHQATDHWRSMGRSVDPMDEPQTFPGRSEIDGFGFRSSRDDWNFMFRSSRRTGELSNAAATECNRSINCRYFL